MVPLHYVHCYGVLDVNLFYLDSRLFKRILHFPAYVRGALVHAKIVRWTHVSVNPLQWDGFPCFGCGLRSEGCGGREVHGLIDVMYHGAVIDEHGVDKKAVA